MKRLELPDRDLVVLVAPDADAAAREVAGRILVAAHEAVDARGRFVVAVSGGTAPRPVYRLLSRALRSHVAWERVHLWYTDERCVPPEDPRSNHGMVSGLLLDHVPIPDAQVHRFAGELPPADAARRAEDELRAFMREAGDGPTFDLVLIGIGEDGHTASLFLGDAGALAERERLALHTRAPQEMEVADRLTFTFPVLSDAREVLLLAPEGKKQEALRRALDGSVPGGRPRGREGTVWVVTKESWEGMEAG